VEATGHEFNNQFDRRCSRNGFTCWRNKSTAQEASFECVQSNIFCSSFHKLFRKIFLLGLLDMARRSCWSWFTRGLANWIAHRNEGFLDHLPSSQYFDNCLFDSVPLALRLLDHSAWASHIFAIEKPDESVCDSLQHFYRASVPCVHF